MSQNTHELKLGKSWEQNPPEWRNFVWSTIRKHDISTKSNQVILDALDTELTMWGLRLEGNVLSGSESNLTAWQLSHA